MKMTKKGLHENLKNKKVSTIGSSRIGHFSVVTDRVEYHKPDQVFPLHPENQFCLDEIDQEKIKGAKALDIGTGSGVLSIAAVKAGAEKVISLEINPRAIIFAGFNIMVNGMEGRIEIRHGDSKDIYSPVMGERFDYIISDPPFEPTPPGIGYYLHSSGGMYGLDFVEKIFIELDAHLHSGGHAQVVSFSPGNQKGPFMLVDIAQRYLKGKVEVIVNPVSMLFEDFISRFIAVSSAVANRVERMKKQARLDGISHLYLCMVHYEKGEPSIKVRPSDKTYKNWDLPIGSTVPMGHGTDSSNLYVPYDALISFLRRHGPGYIFKNGITLGGAPSDDAFESVLRMHGPRFIVRDGVVWVEKYDKKRLERLGRFIGVYGSLPEANEAIEDINRHWWLKGSFEEIAFSLSVTMMAGEDNVYRTPTTGDAVQSMVVDPRE